ncbi:unnamed protein product, partial [Peniophora sp. CBMAI 1063]
TYNGPLFLNFIQGLLDNMNPFPLPNSVIIMDNAFFHHGEPIWDAIESRGMRLEFLSPYSPDLDPIEEEFSAMKAWLRRNQDVARGELSGEPSADPFELIRTAVFDSMTPDNIAGWYRHSHYTT